MISETKLDSSFPKTQFYMKSCSKAYLLDRGDKGGRYHAIFKGRDFTETNSTSLSQA